MTAAPIPTKARERLGQVADTLIQAGAGLPSGAEAGVHEDLLDQVAKARPDLIPPLLRALDELGRLDELDDAARLTAVQRLAVRAPKSYEVLTLVIAGGYLMSAHVGALLNYPFQEARLVDPRDIVRVVDEGLLDQVAEREPFYRLPPDAPPEFRA